MMSTKSTKRQRITGLEMATITEIEKKTGTVYRYTSSTGTKRIRKIFKSYAAAYAYKIQNDPLETKAQFLLTVTLNDAIQLYLAQRQYSNSIHNNIRIIRTILDNDVLLHTIDTSTITYMIDTLRRTRSDYTLLPTISTLRTILRTATEHNYMSHQAYRDIYFPRLNGSRVRETHFTDKQLAQMIEYCKSVPQLRTFADIIVFLVDTGVRWKSEMLNLTFSDVKGDRLTIRAQYTKTKTTRICVLSARVRIIIRDRRTCKSWNNNTIFGDWTRSRIQRAWSKIRDFMLHVDQSINSSDFVLHVLRHTCATKLVATNLTQVLVAQQLGHKNIQTTARYIKVHEDSYKLIAEALLK